MRALTQDIAIEDNAPYYLLEVTRQPGQKDEITEDVMSGAAVREAIVLELAVGTGEIEQNDPSEVVVRWTHRGQTTRSCTYSKVC
ncbi:hypothetical protein [Streptomyces sp. A1136]|uniref:hypothetical protein n=1 Tax=Streptomyces sp. A1136 TaxID=2563102 RepID=UPI00109E577E|nr:hypothetical protein [Streptomyces sp. A1136]THA54251.1 hypothetical protein E6R62_16945 [Streptomyces sp. A1136]